jgi:predicted sugar kinase
MVDRAAGGVGAPMPVGSAEAVAGLPTGSGDAVGARIEMPADWRVVLVCHRDTPLVWGDREDTAFQSLAGTDDDRGTELESLIDQRMLPAARSADFDAFSDAVYEYGRLSGLYYRGIQGGPYNGPAVGRAVVCLREIGVSGTGQSSWGPTVFGWCRDEDHAAAAVRQLESRLGPGYERWISQVQNTPALTRFQTDLPPDSARYST